MTDAQPDAGGKRMTGLTAETPVGKAARRIIAARLAVVRAALPAAGAWGPDPEPVHHLRVASRRASAALDVFADLLPGRTFRRARKALKRLRRAAGAARDSDVFIDSVRTWAVHQSPADRPGLHFLLGHVFAQRQDAQADLAAVVGRWQAGVIDRLDDVADKARSGKRESLGHWAVPVLAGLIDDLTAAASADLDDYVQLHRVRILGKRLRYALELFIDCFPPAVREQVCPRVEAMQDILGQANDSYQATQRLDGLLDILGSTQSGLRDLARGGIEALRAYHRQRVREQRKVFGDWWRTWQSVRPESLLSAVSPPAKPVAAPPAAAESPARSLAGL
jgi:CHAD domain-containing protein